MAEVGGHPADVIDRAHRDDTPTIITRRGEPQHAFQFCGAPFGGVRTCSDLRCRRLLVVL
ncbi:type II toxin-antitoxin system prevent-host-death family antitoxin [Streptacidiphilus sp. EB129]|uniref:type II toxin-antitoxin system prevent-host-death family antitoxin n=1 Tax=Streptacidiphilus sp. EB129 TaxID=3156262 RepID=UPI003519C6E8